MPRTAFSWCAKAALGCRRLRDRIECNCMATKTVKKINRKPVVRYIADLQCKKTEAVLPISIYHACSSKPKSLRIFVTSTKQ